MTSFFSRGTPLNPNVSTLSRLRLESLDCRIVPHDGHIHSSGGELFAGHVDIIEVEFIPAEENDGSPTLELVSHDEELDRELDPASTTFVVKAEAQTTRPAGSQFDFIGTDAGKSIWLLPQVQNPNLLFGGVAAEEIESGTFLKALESDPRINATGEFVRVRLVGFSGPGEASVWANDVFGKPIVFVRTSDGVGAQGTPLDAFFAAPGAHQDYNWGFTAPGEYNFVFQATAKLPDGTEIQSEETNFKFFVQSGAGQSPPRIPSVSVATGGAAGSSPRVRLYDPTSGQSVFEVDAYDPSFTGGVNSAVGDVTGDGVPDLVTGAGVGGGPHVKVFDGVTGKVVAEFFPYESTFRGGVTVALGDVNGDGKLDIICGTGTGGGPRVAVFDVATRQVIADFLAYEESFRGGVTVAGGDYNGDGFDDIAVGTGVGGAPRAVVVNGKNVAQRLQDFFAYEESFRDGIFVSLGDFDDDHVGDLVVGSGVGGAPRVRAVSASKGQIADFFAFDKSLRGGVSVGAVDGNGDGTFEILCGTGTGSQVRRFDGAGELLNEFQVEGAKGVRVAGSYKKIG